MPATEILLYCILFTAVLFLFCVSMYCLISCYGHAPPENNKQHRSTHRKIVNDTSSIDVTNLMLLELVILENQNIECNSKHHEHCHSQSDQETNTTTDTT